MSTKEKQATLKAAFVFLVPLENEQPAEAGGKARQRGLVIGGVHASEDSRAVHRKGRSRLLITGSLCDRKFLSHKTLREDAHLAEMKYMLRIPLGRERVASDSFS